MKLVRREATAEFKLDQEKIDKIQELIARNLAKMEKAHARIKKFREMHDGVANGLCKIVEENDPSIIAKLRDGDTSVVNNWEEVKELAPWALDCLTCIIAVKAAQKELEDTNRLTVGSVVWKKNFHAPLSIAGAQALSSVAKLPHLCAKDGTGFLWLFRLSLYSTSRNLSVEDMHALLVDMKSQEDRAIERARATKSMAARLDETGRRQPIPHNVKMFVWQRDGGRCVQCSSQKDLEFDHIIPLVLGGSNTERNLQLLCAMCNNKKGGTLG